MGAHVSAGHTEKILPVEKNGRPSWVQEHGLEWFFRLCHEPRRLWRRYLVYGAEFAALVLLEALRLKKFP